MMIIKKPITFKEIFKNICNRRLDKIKELSQKK